MMAAERSPRPRDYRALFWAMTPVLLLGGLLGTQLIMLASALDDPSFSVESRYYEKAVSWDAKMAQDRENARLGWKLDVTTNGFGKSGSAAIRLHDAGGEAITGAQVTLEAFPNARASHVQSVSLYENGPGTYSAPLTLERPGLWEFRVDVRRRVDHFTAVVRRDVSPEASP